ncbi:MAG: competence/damage-inducible protein A [Verrucomicrobia bacterium]|nr:competence/damage-inducible protein A [Verrucomicrobiota bacterium]
MRTEVELISTGSELLSGRTLNRHAQYLGEELARIGLRLTRDTTLGDDRTAIADAVRSSLERVDVVFVTGGLGPTVDDVTRDSLADVLNREVVTDEESLRRLHEKYASFDRTVTEGAARQALIVQGARALPNSVGVSPGELIEIDGRMIFLLPGPPRELKAVFQEHVVPCLVEYFGSRTLPEEKVFQVCGMGESDIISLLEINDFPPEEIDIAYCAAPGRVEVRLSAPHEREDELESAASALRSLLGHHVFTEDRRAMEEVVGGMLRERGVKLATAESCTGGLVGERITAVAGSSDYYLGGIISYANKVKVAELGVDWATLASDGAVSEAVARQMAEGVRESLGADYSIAVTGIAGPAGGTEEKPVGLVYIAVADKHRTIIKKKRFPGDREWIRLWTCQFALDLLRRRLIGAV